MVSWNDFIGGLKYSFRHPRMCLKHVLARSNPLRQFQYWMAQLGHSLTENERALLSLRDRHIGKRCFIIGNGPSLKLEDLEKLKGEVSIASNKIYVAFEEVTWRPTYYTVTDPIYAEKNADQINALELVKLFPDYFKRYLAHSNSSMCRGTTVYYRPIKTKFSQSGKYQGNFSANALRGFHPGRSVTILNIQISYYLGCNPIYLIGIDGDYRLSTKTVTHPLHGVVHVFDGEQNYFHPSYREKGEIYQRPDAELVETGYKCCRDFIEGHDRQIFNASRRSSIDVFERVQMDEIIG
jgi:hypothetical protein